MLLFLCLVHIIVATPGRILDLLNKALVKTDSCKILVLDEVSRVQDISRLGLDNMCTAYNVVVQ